MKEEREEVEKEEESTVFFCLLAGMGRDTMKKDKEQEKIGDGHSFIYLS